MSLVIVLVSNKWHGNRLRFYLFMLKLRANSWKLTLWGYNLGWFEAGV